MNRFKFIYQNKSALSLIFYLFTLYHINIFADSTENQDQQLVLTLLESFLFNSVEMEAYAKEHPEAKKAQDQLKVFPEWAQKEILKIVMMIMKEKKDKTSRHVSAYQEGGAISAHSSFSPEIQKAISDLAIKLQKDPAFKKEGSDNIIPKNSPIHSP